MSTVENYDSTFFEELLGELEIAIEEEDGIAVLSDASEEVLAVCKTIIGEHPSQEAINLFSTCKGFVDSFGYNPDGWSVSIEKLLKDSSLKKKNILTSSLQGFIRESNRIYFLTLSTRFKKNIRRLETNTNNNDYTKSVSIKLPSYSKTKEAIKLLNTMLDMFQDVVDSPKSADPKEIRNLLKSVGITCGNNPFNRKEWAALASAGFGAAFVSIITGGVGVFSLIGAFFGLRISERGSPIYTRGWTSNARIQETTEQMYELLEGVFKLQQGLSTLGNVELKDLSKEDQDRLKEACKLLKMCEPAYRKIVFFIGSGLSKVVKLTAKDLSILTKELVEKMASRKLIDN